VPIVGFRSGSDQPSGGWRRAELRRLLAVCSASVSSGAASGWAFGETERGDPQLYLLGPEPECDCILCISRLDDLYILEDGKGRLVSEHNDLPSLGEQVAVLRGTWAKRPPGPL
jgi:hypothetical protein